MSTASPPAGRIFVAVALDEGVRTAIRDHLAASLFGGRLPGRAVPPENWHLTVRFLGDMSERQLARLLDGLGRAELGPAFDLAFTTLGAFPRPDRARVLWLGTGDGADELRALAAVVERDVVALGFEAERRPFRGHLTLARLKPEEDVRDVLAGVPALKDARMRVSELRVYRSHLGRSGAAYEVLARFPLAPPSSRKDGRT